LAGTIIAGFIRVDLAAVLVFVTALTGYFTSRQVPPAPATAVEDPADFASIISLSRLRNSFKGVLRPVMALPVFLYWTVGSSIKLVRNTMRQPEVFYAIIAI